MYEDNRKYFIISVVASIIMLIGLAIAFSGLFSVVDTLQYLFKNTKKFNELMNFSITKMIIGTVISTISRTVAKISWKKFDQIL